MADKTIDTSLLPEDVRLKLEELEIELAEGDITQKGYEKKRTRLLANYVSHSPAEPSAPSPQTAAQRKAHRRLTREDNRYHSEIRTEAVMQALALHKKPVVPLPSKRTSVQYPGQQQRPRERHESSSDDDDSIFGDDQHRDFQRGGRYRDSGASSSSFSDASASPHHGGRGGDSRPHSAAYAIPGNTSRQALADVLQSTRHSQPISQPPDVTNNAKSTRQADRVGHYAPAHISSVRMNNSGNISGLQDDEIRHQGKVSAKIQQLLNTLKRPKRKPLTEFFVEEDDALETPAPDPNAPKPEGSTMSPFPGEPLVIPTGLPRNLESALQRYGSSSYKANAVTVLDQNGKPSLTLTYGKLLARTQKIAYNMLQKTGHKGEGGILSLIHI